MIERYKKIGWLFLLVMLGNQMLRLIFFLVNRTMFMDVDLREYLRLVYHSLRFDLSVFFSLNLFFIALAALPIKLIEKKIIRQVLLYLFAGLNVIAFLFELADIGYFPYVRKRMTWDVFELLGRQSDFLNLLPSYALRFWYLFLLIFLFSWIFIYLSKRIWNKNIPTNTNLKSSYLLLWAGIIGVGIIGIRGGLQLKPILINNALLVASNEHAPLVYNSVFSILHSMDEQKLTPIQIAEPNVVDSLCKPIKCFNSELPFQKKNVVVIILESFGKSYTGYSGRKSYTPFLDSLAAKSLICTKAFANANTSAMGIPAVLAGIPAFYNEAFTTSPYGTNKIDALGNLLRKEGYRTSFFHGGTNGTMNFNVFAKNAGFDNYFGRNEYPNQQDYDGTWGIWDENYLAFFAKYLLQEKQPFASTIFTLSSHEPFSLPPKHPAFLDSLKNIQRGIAYTDYALRLFFNQIQHEAWFQNTLFVITADHAYMACQDDQGYYNQGFGLFSIPILYFDPGNASLVGQHANYTQQIDILPSVLDYLHYPNSFFAFGNSIWSVETPYVINVLNGQHLFQYNKELIQAQDTTISKVFDLKKDSNLVHQSFNQASDINLRYKAFLQLLHQSLIENKMSAETYP